MAHDAIIIGAGMAGLASGIRLSMFGKKVVILEKHTIPGGLNSYYQRKNLQHGGIRQFDVGLHALTNFIKKGEKAKPFSKLLKQLRLSWDDFKLCPQTYSEIHFPEVQLKFSNDFELLTSEVHENFPHQVDAFQKLVTIVKDFNELDLNLTYESSRQKLKTIFSDELLIEMLLCPLLIYGSAWEEDMDFAQFVIMFKSLYFEGFSRPVGGVRTIIDLLKNKYLESGGELRFKCGVEEILIQDNKAIGVRLQNGEELYAKHIFSSMGLPETLLKTKIPPTIPAEIGKMTFLESIFVFDKKPSLDFDQTIIFYNSKNKYDYKPASDFYDPTSAVVCFPDNYESHNKAGEGIARITYMSNYSQWKSLEREAYLEKKAEVAASAKTLLKKLNPQFNSEVLFTDVFSPTTIERYTWHLNGTVYGSTTKVRDGRLPIQNLFIIGTDQGFLGIVGAMLSGISMANLHGLMEAT
jgi:phytoene dehydrogenase-like protein